MIRSLYNCVSGMITLENKQNTITNNISNANTNAYKAEDLSVSNFNEVLIQNKDKIVGNKNVKHTIGSMSLGASIDTVITKFTQGDIKMTDNNTDFAIDGRGFFVVQSGNNQVFTRDGKFLIDNTGYLITTTGDRVLSSNNQTGAVEPIFIGRDNSDFYIDADNKVYVNGQSTNTLLTADFEDYSTLDKIGDNYYQGDNPIFNAVVSVHQNALESSNVSVTNETVNMITVMRNFESVQKAMTMVDDTLGIAASKVGKI